tara:strand:+ start:2176 stop:2307 length:132 start_codon:yes stop_codon:yes gene_type:complete
MNRRLLKKDLNDLGITASLVRYVLFKRFSDEFRPVLQRIEDRG